MSKRSTWRISTVLSLGGLQLSAASLSAVSISTIAHNTDRRSIFGLWKIQLQLFRSYCWPLLPSEAPWIASHQPTKPHPSLRAGSSPPLSTMAQIASTRGATMDKIMSTWWIDINTTKTASDIETLLSKTHFLTSSTVPKCNLTFLICWMRTAAKKMPFFDIDPQHLIQQGHPARSWHVDDTVEFETRNYRGEAQTTSGLIVVEGRSATDSAWAHELALPILWSKKMWWCHEHPYAAQFYSDHGSPTAHVNTNCWGFFLKILWSQTAKPPHEWTKTSQWVKQWGYLNLCEDRFLFVEES